MPKKRHCVDVVGGREPAQREAYPNYQYIHTNGALRCCDQGGCWKSRVVPQGDGDAKDAPEKRCVNVVHLSHPALSFRRKVRDPVPPHAVAGAPGREMTDFLPDCLHLVTARKRSGGSNSTLPEAL